MQTLNTTWNTQVYCHNRKEDGEYYNIKDNSTSTRWTHWRTQTNIWVMLSEKQQLTVLCNNTRGKTIQWSINVAGKRWR